MKLKLEVNKYENVIKRFKYDNMHDFHMIIHASVLVIYSHPHTTYSVRRMNAMDRSVEGGWI